MASKSVMPRSAIAAWKRGSARTSSSASISSVTTAMGWMSVRSRHVATLPESSETTASIVRSASRSRITISASRGGGGPPSPQARIASFAGSRSAIVMKRLRAPSEANPS